MIRKNMYLAMENSKKSTIVTRKEFEFWESHDLARQNTWKNIATTEKKFGTAKRVLWL